MHLKKSDAIVFEKSFFQSQLLPFVELLKADFIFWRRVKVIIVKVNIIGAQCIIKKENQMKAQ